ncbi:indolepyruvate oxidoreductase subunit beta [Desulfurispira natronophila]|uniref:Indolepyruvate ferredoxin oxidoreductase beta subunit n=1 Tax=Desulfurispira natronophila TaxID=682562 RepID=A0A7W7Y536_9BACT|nr:indolepyruvate oxidoreductase subunit beta [Desulfurispira natronophila]MBB5022266.1 indolepyruvate ferredoxin oxidoreductase beta subunit [Desulfurispira natronophila]
MEDKITNILLAGVGGQGILLTSEILSEVALGKGLDVKKSEVHGMAQRGGSVVSHVRIGKEVHSPLIRSGEANFLLSFEKMETLRWQSLISRDTVCIVNDTQIFPTNVNVGLDKYPEDIDAFLDQNFNACFRVDASKLAVQAGTAKAANIVLVGALARLLTDYDKELWLDAIKRKVPKATVKINCEAFRLGYESMVL